MAIRGVSWEVSKGTRAKGSLEVYHNFIEALSF